WVSARADRNSQTPKRSSKRSRAKRASGRGRTPPNPSSASGRATRSVRRSPSDASAPRSSSTPRFPSRRSRARSSIKRGTSASASPNIPSSRIRSTTRTSGSTGWTSLCISPDRDRGSRSAIKSRGSYRAATASTPRTRWRSSKPNTIWRYNERQRNGDGRNGRACEQTHGSVGILPALRAQTGFGRQVQHLALSTVFPRDRPRHGVREIPMTDNDTLADALSGLDNAGSVGKLDLTVQPASNTIGSVLEVIYDRGYIDGFEFVDDGKAGRFEVDLKGKI